MTFIFFNNYVLFFQSHLQFKILMILAIVLNKLKD